MHSHKLESSAKYFRSLPFLALWLARIAVYVTKVCAIVGILRNGLRASI